MGYKMINPDEFHRVEMYKLLVSAVVPRPIGWISTLSRDGIPNAAPFSWFNNICTDPPMVMVSFAKRKGGVLKDTLVNIRDTGEFVANIVGEDALVKMNQCSGDYPPDVNEFVAAGLTPMKSEVVKPDRIAESPIHLECKLDRIIPLGNNSTDLVLGRCVRIHVREDIFADDGYVDARKLRPVCRLGRDEYGIIRDVISIPRPIV